LKEVIVIRTNTRVVMLVKVYICLMFLRNIICKSSLATITCNTFESTLLLKPLYYKSLHNYNTVSTTVKQLSNVQAVNQSQHWCKWKSTDV